MLKKHLSVFLLISLLLGAVIRLWKFWELPFMHDEFSAILRLQFDNFADLIEKGVRYGDTHPAGVQVFLYLWTQFSGICEACVKLPFIMLGIASIALAYWFGKEWVGPKTAILIASIFAVQQYLIFYSQLARPYIFGLAWVLLTAVYWHKLFIKKQNYFLSWVVYSLSFTLSLYSHAFSFLQVGLLGVFSLFYLKRSHLKPFAWSSASIAILYAPHIPVLLTHLKSGSIGGWLPPPGLRFFTSYLAYLGNSSYLFGGVLLLLLIWSIVFLAKNGFARNQGLALLLFLIPLAFGWLYSLLGEPILQKSTLIFAYPFLLLFLISPLETLKGKYVHIACVCILFGGSYSLYAHANYYKKMYFQGYDQIPAAWDHDHQSYETLPLLLATGNKQMPLYYLQEASDDFYLFDLDEKDDGFLRILDSIEGKQTAYAWTDYAPPHYFGSVLARYGNPLKREGWFNSAYYLFDKTCNSQELPWLQIIKSQTDSIQIDSTDVYFQSWKYDQDELYLTENDVLLTYASFDLIEAERNFFLVMSLQRMDGQTLMWQAGSWFNFRTKHNHILAAGFRMSSLKGNADNYIFKTYIWNPNGNKMCLLERKLIKYQIDEMMFGL